MNREAALRLNIFDTFTYTLEMIIQAGQKGIAITSVPIRVNPELRPSRLFRRMPGYVLRSVFTILRIFMTYRPLRFFLALGAVPFTAGLLLGVRWLVLGLAGTPRVHLTSLIVAAVLILSGVQLWVLGLVADLMATNRRLLEDIQLRTRRAELDLRRPPPA